MLFSMGKSLFMTQVKTEKLLNFISAKSFLENKVVKIATRFVFFIFIFVFKITGDILMANDYIHNFHLVLYL